MKARLAHIALSAVALGSLVAVGAAQADEEFLNRFAGSFAGSGQVQRNAEEGFNQVKCTLTGQPSSSSVSMNGECGAFIFSKPISADIRYDAASGRYTGTYVGSSIGPARLSGQRQGDAIVLTITWPQPVNGDTKATMTIRNPGNGQLQIIITDETGPDRSPEQVTSLALAKL